jgi:hypothetical protein
MEVPLRVIEAFLVAVPPEPLREDVREAAGRGAAIAVRKQEEFAAPQRLDQLEEAASMRMR